MAHESIRNIQVYEDFRSCDVLLQRKEERQQTLKQQRENLYDHINAKRGKEALSMQRDLLQLNQELQRCEFEVQELRGERQRLKDQFPATIMTVNMELFELKEEIEGVTILVPLSTPKIPVRQECPVCLDWPGVDAIVHTCQTCQHVICHRCRLQLRPDWCPCCRQDFVQKKPLRGVAKYCSKE